eukprot:scaffold23078_cov32-Tisochrysis_lutea.AAC.3
MAMADELPSRSGVHTSDLEAAIAEEKLAHAPERRSPTASKRLEAPVRRALIADRVDTVAERSRKLDRGTLRGGRYSGEVGRHRIVGLESSTHLAAAIVARDDYEKRR